MPAPMSLQTRVRQLAALAALATLPLLAGCLGEVAPSRGVSGEAVIDLRGLRVRNQTASPADEVFSARFTIYLITGSSRRAVATKTFTAADMDVADTDEGTIFTITFPYTSADDRFEVEGIGLNAQGETIYQVGPVGFTMKNAASQGGQAAVSVTAPPVYVGPGSTAAKLTILPRSATLTEGTTATLSATLTDSKGASIPTTSLRIEWWTQNNSVARFNSSTVGVVTGGQQPGTTWAYARFDAMDLRDSILVTNTVPPTQLKVTNGANQSGPAGSELPQPLQVQVLSASNQPRHGVTVNFVVGSGGGTLSASSAVTDNGGFASVRWRLGATVGAQLVTATVTGLTSVVFSAVATQSTPTASRSTVTVLPTAIQVGGEEATVTAVLRDANGAPMPNVTVSFSGATGLVFSATTGVSNASGSVSTRVHATMPGTMPISVMVGNTVVGSATLQVGARVAVPASISIVSGDNQTVKVGQNFPQPLVIVVRDAAGQPVSGALVDWATQVGDGRMVTDANGQSSATYYLTANWPIGQGTITVSVTGFSFSVTFRYNAVP